MSKLPQAVAGYYEAQLSPHKETLLEMRLRILEVVPDCQEVIKYGMPTFVHEGEAIAGIMAHEKHVGFYPYSGAILRQFPELLAKYRSSKGALQIPPDQPLPKVWVKRLIKARIALSA